MSDAESHLSLQSLTPVDLKQLSRQQKIKLVQDYRASGARNANKILFLATDLLAGGSSGLSSSELYEVYEQVLVASLECGRIEQATMYLNLLESRFGKKSMRVSHLRGLCLEAQGKVPEAKRLYEQLLKDMPTNDFCVKRLSAMYKGEGNYEAAIRVLEDDLVYTDEDDKQHTFFEVHRGDALSAYRELSHLHYLLGNTDKAIFYAEEGLLFDSESFFAHVRLGELYYMKRDLKRCVVEYTQSLLFNSQQNNARAAYGLWQVTNEMVRQHQTGARKIEEEEQLTKIQDLRTYAAETLRRMYAGTAMLSALDAYLQRES
ncbi:Tetratricopeptide repeat [Novymonas esmeraldas]|uniref:ER membrane protein complex subunit 2 n=1 Tax=Novymonas esmeraldas TaxID=1808958 RepID=A0AAW0ENI5_9TRYP